MLELELELELELGLSDIRTSLHRCGGDAAVLYGGSQTDRTNSACICKRCFNKTLDILINFLFTHENIRDCSFL